jgi:hypothetical protein
MFLDQLERYIVMTNCAVLNNEMLFFSVWGLFGVHRVSGEELTLVTFFFFLFFFFFFFIGTTTLVWVSACSTVVEHSQQEGFTECRCQRHSKPSTWRRTGDLERSNFRHKRPPASEATLANPAAESGTMGEKITEKFFRKCRLPRHFSKGILL